MSLNVNSPLLAVGMCSFRLLNSPSQTLSIPPSRRFGEVEELGPEKIP